MEQKKTAQQVTMGFIAGLLFMLAGVAELAAGFLRAVHKTPGHEAHMVFPVIGLVFVCIGSMWIAIAASWKKKNELL